MTRQRLTVPEKNVREYAHELAYRLACEQLAGITDIEERCRKSGARYTAAAKAVTLDYLNRPYHIIIPGGTVSLVDSKEDVPMRDKILILHYFIRAKGTPISGKMITYKELHDGINYYPTFFKRAIEVILNNFKDEPSKLLDIARQLGGQKVDYGDTAVTVSALPYVPLTIVLWRGDSELSPDGNILFDSTIPEYLPTEDITVLCEVLAWKLVRLLKTGGDITGKR